MEWRQNAKERKRKYAPGCKRTQQHQPPLLSRHAPPPKAGRRGSRRTARGGRIARSRCTSAANPKQCIRFQVASQFANRSSFQAVSSLDPKPEPKAESRTRNAPISHSANPGAAQACAHGWADTARTDTRISSPPFDYVHIVIVHPLATHS